MINKIIHVFIFLFLLIIWSCKPEDLATKCTLSGKVKDSNNTLIEGAKIQSGVNIQVYSQINGLYEIKDMDPGSYNFTVAKNGYNILDKSVEINLENQTQDFILYKKSLRFGNDSVSGITKTLATVTSEILDIGYGDSLIQYGHCWSSLNQTPTTSDNKTQLGIMNHPSKFSSNLSELSPYTTYYVKAYAINSEGALTYSQTFSFKTLFNCGVQTVTDIDGNTYHTVQIGNQCWFKENLKVITFKDGSLIGWHVWDYNNSSANNAIYGKLYDWNAVDDSKGLCPDSWHVPTDAEWTTLTNLLGGDAVAGGALKATGTSYWTAPNTGATNSSGFTALPGGYRYNDGAFYGVGNYGNWWSATENGATDAWDRFLCYDYSDVARDSDDKYYGFSVRCVRD